MINYLDTNNINNLMDMEKSSLNATLSIQQVLNKQILTFIKSYIGQVNISPSFNPTDTFINYFNRSSSILNISNENIQSLKNLLKKVDDLIQKLNALSFDDLTDQIKSYNIFYTKQMDAIFYNTKKIESFIHDTSTIDINKLTEKLNSDCNQKILNHQEPSTITNSELSTAYIENTLIISEIQQKVILPYTINNIKNILLIENTQYTSIQDVIDKLYTKPISYYKFPAISRFKETYNLAIKEDNMSKFKALSLSFEMFMNYNLHPAIITACNNLDTLDIYLACLDTNELNSFNYFNIKYEIPPTIIKSVFE